MDIWCHLLPYSNIPTPAESWMDGCYRLLLLLPFPKETPFEDSLCLGDDSQRPLSNRETVSMCPALTSDAVVPVQRMSLESNLSDSVPTETASILQWVSRFYLWLWSRIQRPAMSNYSSSSERRTHCAWPQSSQLSSDSLTTSKTADIVHLDTHKLSRVGWWVTSTRPPVFVTLQKTPCCDKSKYFNDDALQISWRERLFRFPNPYKFKTSSERRRPIPLITFSGRYAILDIPRICTHAHRHAF